MSFFEFPNTRNYDSDLGWLIRTMKDVLENVDAQDAAIALYKQWTENKIADIQDWTEDHVAAVEELAQDLQNFVNTYFNNLDVQQEINNKINDMAQDGSLLALLQSPVTTIVGDWLTAHLTPTNPPVDNTLSISGAAADAKVTGDRINLLDFEMDIVKDSVLSSSGINYDSTESGYWNINNGSKGTSAQWVRTAGAFLLENGTAIIAKNTNDYTIYVCAYNTDAPASTTFIAGYDMSTIDGMFSIDRDVYVTVSGRKIGSDTPDASEIFNTLELLDIGVITDLDRRIEQTNETVTEIKDFLQPPVDLSGLSWVSGYYNQNTGSPGSSAQWIRNSTLIKVPAGTVVNIDNNDIRANIVLYVQNAATSGNYISGLTLDVPSYTIPQECYLGLSLRNISTSITPVVDDLLTHINVIQPDKITEFEQKLNIFDTVYVSSNGSDDNDGSYNAPFATVYHAATVSNNIIILPGTYTERVIITNPRESLNISAYQSNNPSDKVIFDLSDTLECDTVENDIALIPFTATSSDYMYTVFVSRTQTLIANQSAARGKDYRCQLWSEDGNTQYIPVVTDDPTQMAAGEWTYDGTNIMIKGGSAGTYKLASRGAGNIIDIENVENLLLSGIEAGYTYRSIAVIRNCNNYEIYGCDFSHSSIANGVELGLSNGELHKCKAHHNCNDGFSYHDCGVSEIVDCESYYSASGDGISHHECCIGTIIGGRYYHNGKAGISDPTYGADINIYNAFCYDNEQYGIQVALSSGGGVNNGSHPIIVMNCLMANNPIGLAVSGYTVDAIGCKYSNNTTDTNTSSGGTINTYN